MLKHFPRCFAAAALLTVLCLAQESETSRSQAMERIVGSVIARDRTNGTVTVREDKTGTEYTVQLANTKTLLKVDPGAKNLKNATRITADDLAPGDRVQIGGSKTPDSPNSVVARSVILMSARDLAQMHQTQAAAWQHSTAGVVSAVDTAGQKLNVTARTPDGTKAIVVNAGNAEFTRYSPQTPQTPITSQLADIHPGDQIRIIGDSNTDGSSITAQRVYSSSFRTVVGTLTTASSDAKEIVIKNLQTKEPVKVMLNDASVVRRLPPMLAYALARRFNPDFRRPQGGGPSANSSSAAARTGTGPGDTAGSPLYGAKAGEAGGNRGTQEAWPGAAGARYGMRGARNGDLSQILDRVPKISVTDLKPGDAVIVSGWPNGADKSQLMATNVIAGVEPIFQSASPSQAQSLNDWGASLGGGGMEPGAATSGGGPPQ